MRINQSFFNWQKVVIQLGLASLLVSTFSARADVITSGQRLTFVLSENKSNADEVRKKYFSYAFPKAQAAGMKEITTFKPSTIVSDGNPDGSGLYLWPSKAAASLTRDDPVYVKDYKPLRTLAWNQLQSVDIDINTPLEINIDKTKVYSAALIWLKDQAKYDQYFKATQAVRDRLGVKTVLKLPAVRYDKLTKGEITPPDLVVILQWSNMEDLQAYSNSTEFKAVHDTFTQSINSFELYELGFWN